MVIVVLTVPLAINLRERARVELEKDALVNVQTIAASIGKEGMKPGPALDRLVLDYDLQVGGRVVVVDINGIVLADSEGTAVGEDFLNNLRQEITDALNPTNPQATALERYSKDVGAEIMVAAAPVLDEGQVNGAARITRNIDDVNDTLHNVTIAMVLIGLMVLLAGLVIAFVMAGSLARPLTRLATAARRVGAGDLSARAGDVKGASEMQDLAQSFDEMAGRLERTVRSQREFVANASHQLRTPLTGMKLRLESASTEAVDPDVKRQIEAADREVDRLSETVDRMLVMAKEVEAGGSVSVDLRAAADGAATRWQARAATLDTSIVAGGDAGDALANPADLDQVIDNLIDNALAHGRGPVEVTTGWSEGVPWIAVSDHGAGIPENERPRVTERFYRGKGSPSGGSGLGLAIAKDLADKWGGSLRVGEAPGGGTRVEFRLRPAEAGVVEPTALATEDAK